MFVVNIVEVIQVDMNPSTERENRRWMDKAKKPVKCRYNEVFGVQEIDRVIAVTAL